MKVWSQSGAPGSGRRVPTVWRSEGGRIPQNMGMSGNLAITHKSGGRKGLQCNTAFGLPQNGAPRECSGGVQSYVDGSDIRNTSSVELWRCRWPAVTYHNASDNPATCNMGILPVQDRRCHARSAAVKFMERRRGAVTATIHGPRA